MMEVVEIIADFVVEEVMGVDEGLADAGIDGLFGLGESSLDLLVVFELVEADDIEVPSAAFIDVVDEEVPFDLGSCAFGHLNKIILISMVIRCFGYYRFGHFHQQHILSQRPLRVEIWSVSWVPE